MNLIVSRLSRLPFAPTVTLMFVTVGALLGALCPDALIARIAQTMPVAAMVAVGVPARVAVVLLLVLVLGGAAWLIGSRVGARLSETEETLADAEPASALDPASDEDGKRRPINVAELGAPLMSDEALANADALQLAIAARIEATRNEQGSEEAATTAISHEATIDAAPIASRTEPQAGPPLTPGFSVVQGVPPVPSVETVSQPPDTALSLLDQNLEPSAINRNVFVAPTDDAWGYRQEPASAPTPQTPEMPARAWPLAPVWASDAPSAPQQLAQTLTGTGTGAPSPTTQVSTEASPSHLPPSDGSETAEHQKIEADFRSDATGHRSPALQDAALPVAAPSMPEPAEAAKPVPADDARLDRLSVLLDRLERSLDQLAMATSAASTARASPLVRAAGKGKQSGPPIGQSIASSRENFDERIDRAFARLGTTNN